MPSSRMSLAAALGLLLLASHGGPFLQAQRPSDPYYERSGMWCGNYDLDPGRTRMAVLAALANMHMLVFQEGYYLNGNFLDTKTVDGFETRITLVPLALPRPATQICVRIGGFGTHRQVCARILDEVGRNLDAARKGPPGVMVVPTGAAIPGPPPLIVLPPGSVVAPPVSPPPSAPAK